MHHFVTNGVVGYISLGNEPKTSLMVWACTHCGSTKKCHKSDPFTGLFPLMWLETRPIPLPVPIPNISTKTEYIREPEFNRTEQLPVMYSVMLSFSPHQTSLVSPLHLSKASLKTDHFWSHGTPLWTMVFLFPPLAYKNYYAITFWLNEYLISGSTRHLKHLKKKNQQTDR